ncbi:hypothetical protein ABZ388_06885 [Micromonospora parva]|uniref:hypothetical protein n=1 Tax=Micromonospora parva TaxID=1464048 RepID=UPI0033D5815B
MTLAPEAPVIASAWEHLPLTPEHRALLESAAISAEVAAASGVYSITAIDQLPAEFASYGESAVPALAFPYRSPFDEQRVQLRPDVPVVIDGKPSKYLWAKDAPLVLNALTRNENATMVLIVEGTKQALAAASHAPEGVEVLGMVGCRGWYRDGAPTPELAICDDRDVVIALDADAATNLDVYTAGLGLADAVLAEGARSAKFVRLTGGKKAGLDDILGTRPAQRRGAYLARLIESAKPKPADAKPKPPPKKRTATEFVTPTDRGMIVVNGDRYEVITELTRALLERHDANRLFCYGGVISQRKGVALTPVNKDAFGGIVAETAVTVLKTPTPDGEDRYVHAWPDGQTMGAILANAERFSPLDKLSEIPFVRPDGSVCQTPGYDAQTRTFLVLDPELEVGPVPADPTPGELSAAVKLILDEWLGDFPLHTAADRANVLALVLTPFIRGLVPLAPLAVIDAKDPGTGKNLLADSIHRLVTGRDAQPLPYTTDDAEHRKVITAAFRSGAEVFVFDEAHELDGASFARAITSVTYQDRVLGVSNLAEFPNRVTWISLGNQVRVYGDMGRRVYRIRLSFPGESPENRPAESFRHQDLRAWTAQNRASLIAACLTLVRGWFAAGQPTPRLPFSMGSFEAWQKVLTGVLDVAGVEGFLGNVREWRSESDFEHKHWVAHLAWLYETFGSNEFLTGHAAEKLDRAGRSAEYPHDLEDPTVKGYARKLGQAYAKQEGRVLDGYQLVKAGTAHKNVSKWRILPPSSEEEGGNGGNVWTPTPFARTKKSVSDTQGPDDAHVIPRIGAGSRGPYGPSVPSTSPIAALLPLAVTQAAPVCRECREPKELVPPGRFWFACPRCHPATFTRD